MTDDIEIAVIGAGPVRARRGRGGRPGGHRVRASSTRGASRARIAGYPTYRTFFSTRGEAGAGRLPFITVGDAADAARGARVLPRASSRHFGLDVRQYEEVVAMERGRARFVLRTRRRAEARPSIGRQRRGRDGILGPRPTCSACRARICPRSHTTTGRGCRTTTRTCVVVGGGNSAVEAALDLFRSGARVTLVHFRAALDAGVKPWVLPDIQGRLESGEIAGAVPSPRRRDPAERAWCSFRGGRERRGDRERLRLRHDRLHAGPVDAPVAGRDDRRGDRRARRTTRQTMETDVPGVFMAGVVAGGKRPNQIFIENGREHGPRIVEAVRGAQRVEAGTA